MGIRKLVQSLVLSLSLVAAIATGASAGGGRASIEPQVVDDSTLKALTTTEGGADVLPTTKTVAHWFGQTRDPNNGVTYGYNMVGANPNTCTGAACDATVQVDSKMTSVPPHRTTAALMRGGSRPTSERGGRAKHPAAAASSLPFWLSRGRNAQSARPCLSTFRPLRGRHGCNRWPD